MYSSEIYNLFKEILGSNSTSCHEDAEKGQIILANLGIDSLLKSMSIVIDVHEEDCYLMGFYNNLTVPNERLANITELLMRINCNFLVPQFIINYGPDGKNSVVCHYRYELKGDLLNTANVAQTIIDIGNHMQLCGNAIMAVSLGMQTPIDALNSVLEREV